MEADCCTSSYGQHWKKPEEIMKSRRKKSSRNNSAKRTLEKRSAATTLSPKPPKPNPFKVKSSEIKRLEKENKANVSFQGNLLKVCSL